MHNFIKVPLIALIVPLLFSCSAKTGISYLDKSYQTDTITVDLKIPQLSGMADKDFQNSINTEIQDKCNDFLHKFKESAKDLSYPAVFSAETTTCETNNLFSLVTQIDYYTKKPHNNSFRIAETINTKTSEKITLKDLFEGDSYIDFLNSYLEKTVQENQDTYKDLWAKPVLSENQDFYITEDSLVIYYPPYELSYYTRGFVEFSIPLSDTLGYLTEEYRQIFSEKS